MDVHKPSIAIRLGWSEATRTNTPPTLNEPRTVSSLVRRMQRDATGPIRRA